MKCAHACTLGVELWQTLRMSAGRQVWCAGLEKLAQPCSWGSYTWQMSRKETYCHCQLKSTWVAEHDLKKIWEHSAMHLAWCYIVDNLPSPLIFHLQTSPVFHQKADGCWTAICDGDSDVLVMLFATCAHPHLPLTVVSLHLVYDNVL